MSEGKMNIGSTEGDQVLELDINRLRDFKNHPFKVTADMSMVELKDSIERSAEMEKVIVELLNNWKEQGGAENGF